MVVRALALALALGGAAAAAAPLHLAESGAAWSATLDFAEAAARFPPLDEALRAEAARALDAFKADAARNADANRPYTFALTDSAAFVSDRYVSVLRALESWTGGAHGSLSVEALTWDDSAGAAVTLDALVTPEGMEAISAAVRAGVAREVHGGAVPDFWREPVLKATVANPMRLKNFTVAADAEGRPVGLDFHFNPYEVGPWSAGAPVIRAALDSFAEHLTAQGAALFAR